MALSEDRELRASLGLKRAELKRLWNLSDALAQAGITLHTPLQAFRALDLLRSLEPGASSKTVRAKGVRTTRRRTGAAADKPDRPPRKPTKAPGPSPV